MIWRDSVVAAVCVGVPALAIVLVTLYVELMAARCSSRWVGWASRYDGLAGCTVEVAPGKWAPAENVRVLHP